MAKISADELLAYGIIFQLPCDAVDLIFDYKHISHCKGEFCQLHVYQLLCVIIVVWLISIIIERLLNLLTRNEKPERISYKS